MLDGEIGEPHVQREWKTGSLERIEYGFYKEQEPYVAMATFVWT